MSDNVIDVTVRAKDDSGPGFDSVKKNVKDVERSVEDLGETWRDASGRLHDSSGKFVAEAEEMGDSVDGAGESMGGFGKVSTAAMATAAAAVAGVGIAVAALGQQISKAMDIEAANDKLAAQLGLTAEASESFGRAAGALYAGAYGESLEEVNEALRYVQQNIGEGIGVADDALTKVSASVLDLSAAFGEDLGPTTRAVGTMIKSGLVTDAGQALDILTVGLQNGVNAGEDLLDTFSEYSTQFREVGVSAEMALGLMSQGMKAGARDSDTLADAIKEFAIRSKDGSTASAAGFAAIGMNAQKMTAIFAAGGPAAATAMTQVIQALKNMKDPVAQDAAAVALFGTKAEDLGDALYALDPTTAVASLGQVVGAAERMGATLADNAKTKLEAWKRTMEVNVSNFIGEQVLPKIVELAERAAPAFASFGDAAKTAFDWIAGKPEALAALAVVVGAVLVAAFVALAAAAWSAAAGVIAATWPFIAIGVAIFALVAGLKYAYENWEWFRVAVDTVVQWLITNVPPAFEMIRAGIAVAVEWIVTVAVPWIQQAFGSFMGFLQGTLLPAVLTVWNAISAGFALMVTVLTPIISFIVQVFQEYFGHLVEIVMNIFDMIRNIIANAWQVISNLFQLFLNIISGNWGAAWDNIKNILSAVWDTIQNVVANGAGVVRELFQGLANTIGNIAGRLGEGMINAGRAIVDGLWQGFNEKIDWVKDKIGGALSSIRNLFPFSPAKEGPFSGRGWVTYSGEAIARDFAKGIGSGMGGAYSAASGLVGSAAGPFGSPRSMGSGSAAAPTVTFNGDTSTAVASMVMALVRSGHIQLGGNM